MSRVGPLGNSAVALTSVASDPRNSLLGSAAASGTQTAIAPAVGASLGSAGRSQPVATTGSVERGEYPRINQRAVYGLYCSWAIAGIMYGFVYNYINIPICQYVFGPMGHPGRSTVAQCNISQTFTCLPWNFQVFYGLFLDRVGFMGTRRKGWIIFGWTAAMICLAGIAFVAEDLVNEGSLFTYMLCLLVMCIFYIFSTVSNDGMTIEFGKLEPPERRGYILTTGQMVRFGAQVVVNLVGILGMNDKYYYPTDAPSNSTIFPFRAQLYSGPSLRSWHVPAHIRCHDIFARGSPK